MHLFEHRGKRSVSFDKTETPGKYVVRGCTVPHGVSTHWDSDCWTGGFAGYVTKEQVHTYSYPRDRNETLWLPTSEDGLPIAGEGDAGTGYYFTRLAAGEALIRSGIEQWRNINRG